jgi:outer membrane scaffolding protein for murein synthesis (MipA/OmpV family)
MARYRITHQWSWGNSVSVDLLGHKGGTIYSTDLGFGTALAPDWRFSAGVGLGLADRTYMSSYYGVSEASAAASGGLLSPYHPKPGPQAVSASAALTWQVHPNWRVGTSVSATQLLEQAQRSPVTAAAFNYNMALGVVFQSRRAPLDDD